MAEAWGVAWLAGADVGRTVATGNLALALVIAAAAGLLSFASPCVLPLVPGFLGYVTGTSTRRRSAALTGAALFVLGFSVVFLAGLALAASVGLALIEYRRELQIVGGVVVLVLAAVFLGAGGQRTLAPQWRPRTGLWGAPLLGAVFAVGWTPCSGPTLGVISVLAATDSPSLGRGLSLGAAYCLGLGVPFLLIAAGWTRVAGTGSWLRRHQRALHLSGGVLLLVVGVLLVSGGWDLLVTEIQRRLVGSFEVLL